MSSYVSDTLISGEEILLRGKISLRKYWLRFTIAIIVAFTAATTLVAAITSDEPILYTIFFIHAAICLLLIAGPFVRYFTNELILTNKRIVAKVGVISITTIELNLDRIEGIRVKQSIFGRMLNYGTVVIVGVGGSQEPIPNIVAPVTFRVNFAAALENLKARQRATAQAR